MTTMTRALTVEGTGVDMAAGATVMKNLALFLAAPWIGLAYVITFPLVVTTVLVKTLVKRSS